MLRGVMAVSGALALTALPTAILAAQMDPQANAGVAGRGAPTTRNG